MSGLAVLRRTEVTKARSNLIKICLSKFQKQDSMKHPKRIKRLAHVLGDAGHPSGIH